MSHTETVLLSLGIIGVFTLVVYLFYQHQRLTRVEDWVVRMMSKTTKRGDPQ